MSAQGTSLNSKKGICYCQYSFAVDGGTAGAISVPCSPIPSGSIITNGVINVTTAVEGTSSTVAIQVASSEDILAATAEATLSLNALLDVVVDGTAANMIKTAANIEALTFTVGVADLTAGVINVMLEYFPPVG